LHGSLKDKIDERLGISPREIFQKIGTEFDRRYIHQLFLNLLVGNGKLWINKFSHYLNNNVNKNIVVSDIRFMEEIEIIKDNKGIVIYIDKDDININDFHISENILSNNFDYILDNDGNKNDLYNNFKKLDIL